jgi:hypothetical protein
MADDETAAMVPTIRKAARLCLERHPNESALLTLDALSRACLRLRAQGAGR